MPKLLKIVSSQYKHLPGRKRDCIDLHGIEKASMLKNEPFSFQVLYRTGENYIHPVSIGLDTELPAKAWRVDYVAVQHTFANKNGKGFASAQPGLFPDLLTPRPAKPEILSADLPQRWTPNFYYEKDTDATLNATPDFYQSVWFTLNPDSHTLKAGKYPVRVVMTSLKTNKVIADAMITLEVIDAALPEQDFYYTNWFHVDCLCDLHGVKPYSNAFYRVFDWYIRNMTAHRQNTLLLPAFTPILDTVIGMERMNVQLVDVERLPDGWRFGFEKMRRFVRHVKKCGITVFEHCHLFSQWGAEHTPNIYDKDGKRIFGFDTDASSEEYTEFIRAYLKAFFRFAREEGIENSLIFHISDEPAIEQMGSYRSAHRQVAGLLEGAPVCDAMSDYAFYEKGLVDQPILHLESVEKFNAKTCPSIWLYYTGGEAETANRKISNTAAATRIIGLQMYKYNAKGFLHWAYNFYYDFLSMGFADPRTYTGGYKLFPGISYLAYPINQKGHSGVAPSIREKLMAEAMDDLRALKLLESKIGREATLALCEDFIGKITPFTIPEGEQLRELRELINAKIAASD